MQCMTEKPKHFLSIVKLTYKETYSSVQEGLLAKDTVYNFVVRMTNSPKLPDSLSLLRDLQWVAILMNFAKAVEE